MHDAPLKFVLGLFERTNDVVERCVGFALESQVTQDEFGQSEVQLAPCCGRLAKNLDCRPAHLRNVRHHLPPYTNACAASTDHSTPLMIVVAPVNVSPSIMNIEPIDNRPEAVITVDCLLHPRLLRAFSMIPGTSAMLNAIEMDESAVSNDETVSAAIENMSTGNAPPTKSNSRLILRSSFGLRVSCARFQPSLVRARAVSHSKPASWSSGPSRWQSCERSTTRLQLRRSP